jgi:putative intracellular protease/amidase
MDLLAMLPVVLSLFACLSSTSPDRLELQDSAAPHVRQVAILVYPGVELLDFAGPGEAFSAAHGPNGRAFRVFTVAKTKEPLVSQGFVRITPEFSIADCPAPDIIVIPGGNVPDGDADLQAWIKDRSKSTELVMSVCNGAMLLGATGLLDGHEATTHHGSLESLALATPEARVFSNRRFVDSGKVMTCAGVSAGIDGALHVIQRMLGEKAARECAWYMEYEWRPEEIDKKHAEPGKLVVEDGPLRYGDLAASQGPERALEQYRADAERPDEYRLTQAAYGLLYAGKKEKALPLFRMIAAAFPASVNAHDSLAEACEATGDVAGAQRSAKEALAALEKAKDIEPRRVAAFRNVCNSRLVRLGDGDKSGLRYGCQPCGGECDKPRYLELMPCPVCGMAMSDVGAKASQ